VQALWGNYWVLPLLPALYSIPIALIGDLRLEHVVFALFALGFGFAGPRAKQFLVDVSPIIAVGVGYDLVRYVRPYAVTADRVLGCELRELDVALFPARGGSVQEWLAAHHTPFLDLLFAVPYTIFIYLVFVYGTYLFFRDRARMRHYLLAFAVGNFLSFASWLLLPAAPPWYVHTHGCAIDTSVVANPAGLARVDAMLGINYYASFYGRASAVFGAMPSMHCAYPLIGLLTAWRAAGRTRVIHVSYWLVMSLAAMYLDHHWVVDILAGWITAALSVVIAGAWLRWRARSTATLAARPEAEPRKSTPRRFERPTPVPATYPSD
jgi:membrane-associated phospholipid phosphatase